jgi:Ca2+-binding EF-hand superfamily protein
MKKLLMLTAAAFVLQASPVLAGDQDGMKDHAGKMFAEHDADGDGAISEAEFLAGAKKKFAESDTNGDGSISQEEAKAHHEARRAKMKEMRGKWKEKRQQKMEESSEAVE